MKHKFSGDVQEFAPFAIDSLLSSGQWERVAAQPKPAAAVQGVQETAAVNPSIIERITRPLFQRGPRSR
jgi:hypothetical protein